MNLGTPDPVRSAIRSDNPPYPVFRVVGFVVSAPEDKRSEKEVVMNGWVEKVKLLGWEFAEVSKLPEEEAIREKKRGGVMKKMEINMRQRWWRRRRGSRIAQASLSFFLCIVELSQKLCSWGWFDR